MISFFSLASNDQSYYYLGQIFGNVGTVLQAQNAKLLLGLMFKSLNTTALIVGALLVTHTTIVGLLKTAQEGEFLGRQWSSLWVPTRMVVGIASLFPTASGYSVLQIILMWIIIQGVGAADSLWTVVLNYVSVAGSPYASVALPTSVSVNQDMQTLFQALTCSHAAQATYPDQYTNTSSAAQQNLYYCAQSNDKFCSQPLLSQTLQNPTSPQAQQICSKSNGTISCNIGPGGSCGRIVFGDPSSVACPGGPDIPSQLKCAAYQAQSQALIQVAQTLDAAAADVVQYDWDYMQFYNNTNPFPGPLPQNQAWIQNYCTLNGIAPASCCYLSYVPDQKSDPIGYALAMSSSCAKGNSSPFPPSNSSVSGNVTDYGNSSQNAIQQVIWPCAIAPILNGETTPTACLQSVNNSTNFLSASVTYYTNYINTQVGNLMSEIIAENPPALSGFEAQAQAQGWLLAGGYYYEIAAMNNNNLNSIIPPLAVIGANPGNGNNTLSAYRNDYTAASYLVQVIVQQTSSNTSLTSNPQLSSIGSGLNSAASGITSAFMNALTGGGAGGTAANPLVAAQSLGEALLITAQVIYGVFLGLAIVALIFSDANVIALGFGMTANPAETATEFLIYSIWAILMLFLAWCFTVGGLLAIYTPLIPYIIFTFGVIGWFIATIEAMVAAPFVALGILSPGGEHELLGRAAPGLMIIFNTFLRPSLMIMGMMAAMLLVSPVITMINSGFSGVMGSINPNPGILELILFMTAYSMLIVTALNKCFALIHLVPDRVLYWINHQHQGYQGADGSEATGAIKESTGKMAASAGEAAGSAVNQAGKAASNKAESIKKSKAEAAAASAATVAAAKEKTERAAEMDAAAEKAVTKLMKPPSDDKKDDKGNK